MVPLQAGVCYPEEKVRGEVMELVYGDEDAIIQPLQGFRFGWIFK